MANDAKLHGIVSEHRHENLLLDVAQAGMRPHQRAVVGNIDQGEAIAPIYLAGGADRPVVALAERIFRTMAGGAGLLAVRRQSGIVKKVPSELDLGCRHGILFRHNGDWIVFGNIPRIIFPCVAATEGKKQDQWRKSMSEAGRYHWRSSRNTDWPAQPLGLRRMPSPTPCPRALDTPTGIRVKAESSQKLPACSPLPVRARRSCPR